MHRRLWTTVAIFCGGLLGALLMMVDISIPVYLAAAVTALVAFVGHRWWERNE